jgi:hypothetical protein
MGLTLPEGILAACGTSVREKGVYPGPGANWPYFALLRAPRLR